MAIFYLFRIGYNITVENGRFVKKFSWKYPLAISLIIWLFWHFCLYPPLEEFEAPVKKNLPSIGNFERNKILSQKISMNNWY
jgi:hypothetical protein